MCKTTPLTTLKSFSILSAVMEANSLRVYTHCSHCWCLQGVRYAYATDRRIGQRYISPPWIARVFSSHVGHVTGCLALWTDCRRDHYSGNQHVQSVESVESTENVESVESVESRKCGKCRKCRKCGLHWQQAASPSLVCTWQASYINVRNRNDPFCSNRCYTVF